LGRVVTVMWTIDTLNVVAPICVVKDRDVDTREQVLNVLITYWRYEPNKPM
jgi:hypothetical protein